MHSASRQRKDALSVDKENAKQIYKMPPTIAIVTRKVASPSAKLRKNSDTSDDPLPRSKGLQAATTNILANNGTRRRIQSSSDSTTKAFVKSRFPVYGDSRSVHQPTEKRVAFKPRETDKTKDIEKWVKSVNEARFLPSTQLIVEKQKVDAKSGPVFIPSGVAIVRNKQGGEKPGPISIPSGVAIVQNKQGGEKSGPISIPSGVAIVQNKQGGEKSGPVFIPTSGVAIVRNKQGGEKSGPIFIPTTGVAIVRNTKGGEHFNQNFVPSTLPAVELIKHERKTGQTSDFKKSPKNLPIIPKPVCNIKEMHNRKSIPRKTPKVAYEILSLELAYNIDYMTEYIRHQMEINEKKKLSSSFLKRGVSVDQRRLIVKYLIDSTTYYKSPSFVLYQAVKIFDSYIDKVNVSLHELQTVALAALWIALKKDLIIDDIPEADKIMRLGATAHRGDRKPLLECEKKILMSLKFEVNFADSFSMLALFAIMVEEVRELKSSSIQELYYCGSYLMDLSMLDKDLCDVLAIHLAEICTEIALVIIMTNRQNLKDAQWNHWRSRVLEANPILERYLLLEREMNYIRNQLLQKVVLSKNTKSDYYAVYKKYCTKRYGTVASFITNKVSSLFVSKITDPSTMNRPIVF